VSDTQAQPLSVLVIDDDDFGRETLGQILEATGYRVLRAPTGAEALQRLRAGPLPGLIILDLLMPSVDGWEFCAQRQSDPRLADIPVIIVSALDAPVADSGLTGIVGHFAKPIAVPALLEAIRRNCRPR
jgi:CheY-like chemotaxis protein